MEFDEAYFTGGREYGYSDYHRELLPFEWYSELIAQKVEQHGFSPQNANVLIAGAAYGYTVDYLWQNYGTTAYGIDISDHAASQNADVIQGDIRNKNDVKSAVRLVSGKYDVILTEAVLSCLSDQDAAHACELLRKECDTLVHRVWSSGGSDINDHGRSNWYTEHTISEWQQICDPNGQDIWETEHEWQP